MNTAPRRALGATLAFLAVVSIAAAGCGESDAKSDEQQIQDAVSAYASAFADGDGKAVCARLTERAQKEVIAQGKALGGNLTSCQDTIKQLTSVIGAADKTALRKIEVTNVKVNGDTATLQAGVGNSQSTRMRKVDGEWFVDGTATKN